MGILSTIIKRIKIHNQAKQFDDGFNFVMRTYYMHQMSLNIITKTLENNSYPEFYKKGAIEGVKRIKDLREKDLKNIENVRRIKYN